MKFFATALLFAATAMALPSGGDSSVEYPLAKDVTFEQANAKCGNDAVVSCCNKKSTTGDVTTLNKGLLNGVLGNALNSVSLFDGCNDLNLNVPVLNLVPVNAQDLVNKKCQQNIACCQNTRSEANNDLVGVALPCVALSNLI
ncbi:Hydrophobin [Penicillium cataractarum]|uniref:Hydrophobin n=1 Tax=Penicillium cataractarum TaxID=2100454 RepID=A0A9W9RGQ7_9EURO|nr:Hydrophobin [Penicillium cataractarum]KAJ5359732.1 Hydrophobin [Penicillium cataractarum]